MKMKIILTVLLVTSIITVGCSKKDSPQPTEQMPTEQMPTETQTKDMVEEIKDAAVEAVKEAFTTNIDLEKTVADLRAEAAQMDVKSLQEVATKYKEAIAEKEAELKALMDKLSAIPLTEKLGKEAQEITGEIKGLTDGVASLQERFQVYIDALKAKGADVKALLG